MMTIKSSNEYGVQGGDGQGEGQCNDRSQRPLDQHGYSCTHSFRVLCGHTSKTCMTKKLGNKEELTRNDNMGGFKYNEHHQFECHQPGKHDGYIDLINNKSFYEINCTPNTPPDKKKFGNSRFRDNGTLP